MLVNEYFQKTINYFIAPLFVYSLFMYLGLILSDYIFSTDAWYWETLLYILSSIIAFFVIFASSYYPAIFIARASIQTKNYTLLRIISIILIISNIAFSIYSMYFVIKYTIEFQKPRDKFLGIMGGTIVMN